MYEDLNAIAQLKFAKELNTIASQTRQRVQDAANRFAATAGAVIRSGQHDANLGDIRIDGVERMARTLFKIWVDLIEKRNGHVARVDINFIATQVEGFVNSQRQNLLKAFAQIGGIVVPSLVQRADLRMRAVCATTRRDLEIMVRENETFPKKHEVVSMKEVPKQRFSIGRRVLVGMANRPGTIKAVADVPSVMGEFVHEVILDAHPDLTQKVVGCDMRPLPGLDEDLRGKNQTTIHIQNSNVANLNLGSQVGTIYANLQAISGGDAAQQEFVYAIKQLTEAVLQATMPAAEQREVVEALSNIAEQAAKKPEERSKVSLKSLVHYIPTVISSVSSLANLWAKYEPVIRVHLGI